jgi:transcriptional regulator with XRE-family HTH domain
VCRIGLGLSSSEFAETIGVSYQQVNKYERGISRISAGRLYEMARAMNTPITYFYEGVDDANSRRSARRRRQLDMADILDGIHDSGTSRRSASSRGRSQGGDGAAPDWADGRSRRKARR